MAADCKTDVPGGRAQRELQDVPQLEHQQAVRQSQPDVVFTALEDAPVWIVVRIGK